MPGRRGDDESVTYEGGVLLFVTLRLFRSLVLSFASLQQCRSPAALIPMTRVREHNPSSISFLICSSILLLIQQ